MWDWVFFWKRTNKPPQEPSSGTPPPNPELEKAADLPVERNTGNPEEIPALVRGTSWKKTAAEPHEIQPQAEGQAVLGVPALVQRLGHREATVRRSTAEVLARLGSKARAAIPALLVAACDIDAGVRKAAAAALEQIDLAWPTDPLAAGAVPDLIKEMGRRSSDIAQIASWLLGQIGRPAVAELMRAVGQASDIHQVLVARTLGRIGPGAAPAVPALAQALGSEFAHVRQAAAEALTEIGEAAEPATPGLVVALGDWLPTVRRAAAKCLARVGGSADLAIPGLIQLLPDREDEVRQAAVEALGQIGPSAVPSLIEIAQTRDFRRMQEWLKWRVEVSDWNRRALEEDYQREPLKALRNVAWYFRNAIDEHARIDMVHEAALRALGKIGAAAFAAVPVLEQALADPNARVRLVAARALGQVGEEASAALPTLMQRLIDGNKPVRQAAAEALGLIDASWASTPAVQQTLPALVGSLKRGGEEGQVAVDAFVVVGPAAVSVLVEALGSDDRIQREAAAAALGRIGPGAQAAIPALVRASQDNSGWVREAAAQALQKIDPENLRAGSRSAE
jgi:HEAT repeat protein